MQFFTTCRSGGIRQFCRKKKGWDRLSFFYSSSHVRATPTCSYITNFAKRKSEPKKQVSIYCCVLRPPFPPPFLCVSLLSPPSLARHHIKSTLFPNRPTDHPSLPLLKAATTPKGEKEGKTAEEEENQKTLSPTRITSRSVTPVLGTRDLCAASSPLLTPKE